MVIKLLFYTQFSRQDVNVKHCTRSISNVCTNNNRRRENSNISARYSMLGILSTYLLFISRKCYRLFAIIK